MERALPQRTASNPTPNLTKSAIHKTPACLSRSQGLRDETLANSLAALAHGEAHALLDGRTGDELASDGDVVARHGHLHLGSLGRDHVLDLPRDVASAEVEDGHVARHDGVGAAALILLREVDVGLELGVCGSGTRSADDLAS